MDMIYIYIVLFILTLNGFSYLIKPHQFKTEKSDINLTHMVRACGGLYTGIVIIFLLMVLKNRVELAILCIVILMAGLISGRVVSIITDKLPDKKMIVSLIIEIIIAISGLFILL